MGRAQRTCAGTGPDPLHVAVEEPPGFHYKSQTAPPEPVLVGCHVSVTSQQSDKRLSSGFSLGWGAEHCLPEYEAENICVLSCSCSFHVTRELS